MTNTSDRNSVVVLNHLQGFLLTQHRQSLSNTPNIEAYKDLKVSAET